MRLSVVLRPVWVGAAFASAKGVTKQNEPEAEERPEHREDVPQHLAVVMCRAVSRSDNLLAHTRNVT